MDPIPTSDQRADSFDLSEALRVLRERKWIIIGIAVLATAISVVWSVRATPMYEATAQILRQSTTLDQALFSSQVFKVYDQERDLATGSDLVKLSVVAEAVKEELNSNWNVPHLQDMVTVTPVAATNLINITAESPDPEEAAAVANSFARQFILYRQQADRAVLTAAREQVSAALEAMTPEELASERGKTLAQKEEELAVLESMQTGGYEQVQSATPANDSSSPHTNRDAAIALVLGLVVGILIAFLLHMFDRRIKDEETVQKEFGVPVLVSVPRVGRGRRRGSRSAAAVGFGNGGDVRIEAFRTLRSNLKFFEVDRKIQSILITSALPREGKTITTINLAVSLAMSGERVIIVEADLRRPMLQSYLNLQGGLGFTNLLSGTHTVSQVIQSVDVEPLLGGGATKVPLGQVPAAKQQLLCVTAAPLPPNPAELLAMNRTAEVLKELSSVCDYLLVDAPPLLLVSDALELAKKVDRVMLVARMFQTTIDEARKTRRSLDRIGVNALGVVVVGAPRAKSYYRGYEEYHAKA
jgi:polysaccharide biosynthesis transport protein